MPGLFVGLPDQAAAFMRFPPKQLQRRRQAGVAPIVADAAQQIGHMDHLDHAQSLEDAVVGLVMIARAVDGQGIQAPALQQPCPDLGMGGAHGGLAGQHQVGVRAAFGQKGLIGLFEIDPQHDLADVVQQTGQEGFVRASDLPLGGHAFGHHGAAQRVPPELFEVEPAAGGRPREGVVDAGAQGHVAYAAGADQHHRFLDDLDLAEQPEVGRVDQLQNRCAQRRILFNDLGDATQVRIFRVARFDQLQQDMGQRRKMVQGRNLLEQRVRNLHLQCMPSGPMGIVAANAKAPDVAIIMNTGEHDPSDRPIHSYTSTRRAKTLRRKFIGAGRRAAPRRKDWERRAGCGISWS